MLFESDPLALYGRNIIRDYHTRLKARLLEADRSDSIHISDDQLQLIPDKKVGVLGAGIGGLYAALIFDSLDIGYEILEASNRTGGRILTYKFPGGGKYDYYDAGATRFPFPKKDNQGRYKNGVMKRLAELTEYGPLNEGRDRLRDSLIPYYSQARDGSKPGFYYYNGIHEPVSNAPKEPFDAEGMGVDVAYIRAGMGAITNDVTQSFIRMLVHDLEAGTRKGWEVLKANDLYSVRSYMATKHLPSAHLELPPQHIPNNVINWCGLLEDDSDDPLVETVFYTLAHCNGNIDYTDVQWKCFEGGTEALPKKIEGYLNKKGNFIQFGKRVTAISQSHTSVEIPVSSPECNPPTGGSEPPGDWIHLTVDKDKVIDEPTGPWRKTTLPSVTVTVNGNETYNYSHVISTIPLSVLRAIDLRGAELNVMQRNALRMLDYDASTKIAILFKSNWWTTKLGIVGGQTFTDLPICTIIYPSYGIDSSTPSNVLIASYSRKADANRLGALATTKHWDVLLDLVLRDLTEAHNSLHPDVTYTYLKEEFVDMHVTDWSREEFAMGAYAYFAPGGFQDLYASLTYPAADKRLHFAGEAVSTRHAWIVGALDSSWRAVYEYLKVTGQHEKMKKFKELWGRSSEWENSSPFVQTTEENHGPDLLDEHLDLVDRATRNGTIHKSLEYRSE